MTATAYVTDLHIQARCKQTAASVLIIGFTHSKYIQLNDDDAVACKIPN